MATPPAPSPQDSDETTTDSTNSPVVICDSPGDTTIRPARPDIPWYFPGREPPEGYPKPPSDKQ